MKYANAIYVCPEHGEVAPCAVKRRAPEENPCPFGCNAPECQPRVHTACGRVVRRRSRGSTLRRSEDPGGVA